MLVERNAGMKIGIFTTVGGNTYVLGSAWLQGCLHVHLTLQPIQVDTGLSDVIRGLTPDFLVLSSPSALWS